MLLLPDALVGFEDVLGLLLGNQENVQVCLLVLAALEIVRVLLLCYLRT